MRSIVAAIGLAALACASVSADARNMVAGDRWAFATPNPADARLERLDSDGPTGVSGPVLRVTVNRPSQPFYAIMVTQDIGPAIAAGDRVRLRFWARSTSGNPMRAVVEKAGPPYTALAEMSPTLTGRWTRYSVMGSGPGYGANGIGVRFQMGHQAGVVEIAGVEVDNVGPDPLAAAAAAAIRPDAMRARIRKVRMGDLRIVVRRSDGRPLKGAAVRVEQTRHAFLFGCNIFGLEPADASPWQQEYRRRFVALFNYATLPFYWGAFEPQQGSPRYAALDAMAQWCHRHGLVTKGHPLVWHEVYPAWAPKDPDAAIPLMRARVSDLIGRYRGTISYWDVQNEACSSSSYPNTGVGAWVRREGPASVVATTLGWAREAVGTSPIGLLYNDFNTGDANVALLTGLKARNALPDVIGIQSHMHSGPWPLTQVWLTATRFGAFGKPVHFTETTVISAATRQFDTGNPPADWPTTPEGERKQADYVEQFYTVLFSHPSVQGITWWDFADRGAWLNAPAGFLRRDMSAKPVYDRLLHLIHGEWWTRAAGSTGGDGSYRTRAFYGDYVVTVKLPGREPVRRTVSFPTGAGNKLVVVTVP